MPTLYSDRSRFEKELLRELARLLRGTIWRKAGNSLFVQVDTLFISVTISVYRNAHRTSASARFKPMALDPTLWEILGLHENHRAPLSLRANGRFVCSGIPLLEHDVEEPGQSPADVANEVVGFIQAVPATCIAQNREALFSGLIMKNPNHLERGAYAIELVTSLINEEEHALASETAKRFASGELQSCFNMWIGEFSFFELAHRWLAAGEAARKAINAA